jgi:hypothetical protein
VAQQNHTRDHHWEKPAPADLRTPVRNRYFYGKLLDVLQFEMEQEYFNSKRWLLNRLVTGPGVVCGLDVVLTDDEDGIYVMPGLAIDRCGREIIVPKPSAKQPLGAFGTAESASQSYVKQTRHPRRDEECEDEFKHVVLCYHECESDPAPIQTGDCETFDVCAAGSIRERYKIEIRDGRAPKRHRNFPDVISGRRISQNAIAEIVTRGCRALPDDCCIPLANVELLDNCHKRVDIAVRPIVYTNRLLYELLVSLVEEEEAEY